MRDLLLYKFYNMELRNVIESDQFHPLIYIAAIISFQHIYWFEFVSLPTLEFVAHSE